MAKDDKSDDQQTDDVEEQSTEDQADGEESGVEKDDAADSEDDDAKDDDADAGDGDADSDDTEDEESDELISDEKFNALKDDPAALRKALQAAATKKFQTASAMRKAVEPYAEFINAFEEDPAGAALELAQQMGIKVEQPKSGVDAEKAAVKLQDRVSASIKKALGDDYADLADKIAAGMYEASIEMFNELSAPLKAQQKQIINDSSATVAANVIKSFEKSHPDWQKHEKSMTALMAKYPPSDKVTELEYLEGIYTLATNRKSVGEKVKKTIAKMTRNVQRSEGKSRIASDKSVSKGPAGKLPTWAEAAGAALRGEKFD